MNTLRRFPYTTAALALAFIIVVVALVWDVRGFDLPGIESIGLRPMETDDIVIAFLLVIPAFFVDYVMAHQRMHEAAVQAEQLRVLRATMRTVQDIVNNNLNELQLLRLEAEGHVADETLVIFDAAIQDITTQLTALGNMEVFMERPMASGPGLDAGRSS